MKQLHDIDVKNKRVLVRVDYNVPIINGKIIDDFRIRASLKTILYLIAHEAKIIILSHFGRPDGAVKDDLRLGEVAITLERLLSEQLKRDYFVFKTESVIDGDVKAMIKKIDPLKELVMIENIRFEKGEEANDPDFAMKLASLGDIYVNDAFSASHRAHASVDAITKFLPAVAGFSLVDELSYLTKLLENPQRPFWLILGGKKVEDKIEMIANLLGKIDGLIIGGAMSFPFLGNEKLPFVNQETIKIAQDIMNRAKESRVDIVLPKDFLSTKEIKSGSPYSIQSAKNVVDFPADIGPESIELFSQKLLDAKTIFWNGPMGVYEIDEFSAGTQGLAQSIIGLSATTVIGGGDTIAAVGHLGIRDKFSHVSLGGGATLEFLEGKSLPGLISLEKNYV